MAGDVGKGRTETELNTKKMGERNRVKVSSKSKVVVGGKREAKDKG